MDFYKRFIKYQKYFLPYFNNHVFQKKCGFTLVETLIAITILSIGLLAIASMQVKAIYTNSVSGNMTEASMIAQNHIEEFMMMGYDDAQIVDEYPAKGTSTDYTDPNPPDGYVVAWSVDDDNPMPQNKSITITISWQGGGINKSTVFNYIKAEVLDVNL